MSVEDIRWAVNVLLERVAMTLERGDTLDIWRSDAAAVVRCFKHDLAQVAPMQDDQPKAEQAGSPWAKAIGYPFGEELVRRWNAYEDMQRETNLLRELWQSSEKECTGLKVERANCPSASESEYVRRLEDEVALWKERTQEGGRIIEANVEEIRRLRWALGIMWHAYDGDHRPPAHAIRIAKDCFEMGKPSGESHADPNDK